MSDLPSVKAFQLKMKREKEYRHLRTEVKKLREALEWYANKKTWEGFVKDEQREMDGAMEDVSVGYPAPSFSDSGKRARTALKKNKETL